MKDSFSQNKSRRDFFRKSGILAAGLLASPLIVKAQPRSPGHSFTPERLEELLSWKPVYNDQPTPPNFLADLEAALPAVAGVRPKSQRRILVVSATQGFRHNSIPLGNLAVTRMGETTGAYTTVVSDDPANFEPEILRQFDAVVLLNPTQDFFAPGGAKRADFTEEELQWFAQRHHRLIDNLLDFVKAGGGLVGIHSATDANYRHQAYGQAMGAYFRGHPWSASHNVVINIEEPDHPIIAPVFGEMESFNLVEEIYWFRPQPNPREITRVLLSLDAKRSDAVENVDVDTVDVPVAWVNSLGKGKIFYSSLGHNRHVFTNPLVLNHYLAGIQFALGDIEGPTAPREG
jgi:type 1 glutamine amidotransferase